MPVEMDQEAAKFLDRDFTQCFTQMRHYDAQLWDICKFAFTAYSALLGISVGVYQYSLDKKLDLIPAIVAMLAVGLVLGLLLFSLTIRNRVYFVLVTRYINEHRRHFLSLHPLGFANSTRMYTNPTQPPYFNWRSSQAWLSYVLAVLNATLACGFVFLIVPLQSRNTWAGIALATCALAQVASSVIYLRSREGRSAAKAVFDHD